MSKLLPANRSLAACIAAFVLSAIPCLQAAGVSREIVDHQASGDSVQFSLSAPPLSVSLQGLVEKSGRWKNLSVKSKPGQALGILEIPRRWRGARLRVIANYPSESGNRVEIESQIDEATHAVVFTSTAEARLFSVEQKPKNSGAWMRVSTVSAPETPRSIRVPLPSSVANDAAVRVMQISGARQTLYPPLKTPVSSWLRGGPSVFSASSEVVSSLPLNSVQADAGRAAGQAVPTVEESDIWKIRGRKIYFFNRLRGLQLIDASDPENPAMSGSLPLPGSGEEMYLLGSDEPHTAVLITALPWSATRSESTRVSCVGLAGGNPALQGALDLPGYYRESRLVGGILHIVTSSWESVGGQWTPKTYITAVDTSQDGVLVESSQSEFEFSAAQVGSTAKYLWVAGETAGDWSRHALYVFPLKVDGTLGSPSNTVVDGRILDKFKVGDTADGIAVIVQNWTGWQQATFVQTYSVGDGVLDALGQLELVRNESLFASRFDGDRLYVVTFRQVDPLWIVDLSDSAKPTAKGHLQVPGWSSYIQPLGDTLVSVGRDGGKVQISLFDVSDESNPTLAKRVDVGAGWSWSEAEWNEKAVKIIPEDGLILIPVIEWSEGVRKNRVCLLDFDPLQRTLSVRGTIDHEFAPRRAALMDDQYIASVSNRELLLVDASDRDKPRVTSDVTLAFAVDRVVVRDSTALMFEDGGLWSGGPGNAVMRSAPVLSAEAVTSETALPCRRVAAAELVGDRLVVVEGEAVTGPGPVAAQTETDSAVSVWSFATDGTPVLVGRAALPFVVGQEATILPVEGGRVAVCAHQQGWNYWIRPMPVALGVGIRAVADVASARCGLPWIGWGGQGLDIALADISVDSPVVLGTWNLTGEEYSGISDVYSAGDMLVFSYDRRERNNTKIAGEPTAFWPDDWSGWSNRSWLQVLDLADPSAPMPWAPVQLPGKLSGVSWFQRGGGVVFARSPVGIAALSFDGENASLIAEVPADGVTAMQAENLYLATPQGVSEWNFSEREARWKQGAGWNFEPDMGIGELHVNDGAVLAGAYGRTWVLGEDGSVSSYSLPSQSDLSRAEATGSGNGFLVPCGDYGPLLLQ